MERTLALVQGIYFVCTGLWPIFSIGTFQVVTGPKPDLWLVKTAGILISAIGAALTVAGLQHEVTPALVTLGAGSAAGLAGIDLNYGLKRVISPVYLADAVLELLLVACWGLAWFDVV